MSCPNITANEWLQKFDQYLGPIIQKLITDPQSQYADYILNNVPKENWINGSGDILTFPKFERAGLSAPIQVSAADSSAANTCNPAVNEIDSYPSNDVSVVLKEATLLGPVLCLPEIQRKHYFKKQVENMIKQNASITADVWRTITQAEYNNLSGNRVVLTASGPLLSNAAVAPITNGGPGFVQTPSTTPLTWGFLKAFYNELQYEGHAAASGRDSTNKLVYDLVGGSETLNNLINTASVSGLLVNAQQGLNVAGNALLQAPTGAGLTIGGFKLIDVRLPRRFDFTGGVYVERLPYGSLEAQTRGNAANVTAAYKNAEFEEITIFVRNAVTHMVPKPENLGQLQYGSTPIWTGDWKWTLNPVDRACNPHGDKGFFAAKISYGMRPDNIEVSYSILAKRCNAEFGAVECSSYSQAG